MERSEQQERFERIRVQFIIAEIDSAWAVARSAQILYGTGSENVDSLAGKAWEAYERALNDFNEITARKELRDTLRDKLNQIGLLLDSLPGRKPQRRNRKFKVLGTG